MSAPVVGVDILHLDRIRAAQAENNPDYWNSVYTPGELAAAEGHPQPTAYFATRFAAKEAVFKAIGTAWQEQMAWNQIELYSLPHGGLAVRLTGTMQDAATRCGVGSLAVSVSWDTDYAVAFAAGGVTPLLGKPY